MLDYRRNFFGGRLVEPSSDLRCEVRSPFDGSSIGTAPLADRADIDLALQLAQGAVRSTRWGRASLDQRLEVVDRFLALYGDKSQSLITLVTRENGIPLHFNTRLAEQTLAHSLAFVGAARAMTRATCPADRTADETILRRPSGIVAAFTSWSAPQRTALGWIVPALLAGCAIVLALDPRTALDGQIIGELMGQAGLPEGVLSILVTAGDSAIYLAGHPAVDHIALADLGSGRQQVAATAAGRSKRLTLDPEGRAPVILLPDADIAAATVGLRCSGFFASGQWPMVQNRIFVPRHRQGELVECLRTCVEAMSVGDPLDTETYIGPLISARARSTLLEVIQRGCSDGAEIIAGGRALDIPGVSGAFLLPTVMANVSDLMEIARAPLRGPVVVTMPYGDIDEAIELANTSGHSVPASIWTTDAELASTVACRLRSDTVSINGVARSPSKCGAGVWQGGVGGLLGRHGILEFAALQTISH